MVKIFFKKFGLAIVLLQLIIASYPIISGEIIYDNDNQIIKQTITPGDYFRFIKVNNRLRSYRIHIPPSYNDKDLLPLVFVLHGSGITANSKSIKSYSGMDEKADKEGFIAVYPNGELLHLHNYFKHPIAYIWDIYSISLGSREWNRWNDNEVDDVGFIRTLISHLKTNLYVDSSRIYVMGFSGGAMMTYRLGAELSDIVTAIAPIAGSIGGIGYVKEANNSLSPYIISTPINPIPVIAIHELNDKSVPYEGGWKKVFNWRSDDLWVYITSVNDSISFWIENNNCNSIPDVNISNNGSIITKTYQSNSNNSDFALVTYVDGGHEFFNSPPYEISAVEIIWDFFEQYRKPDYHS
jgi:polyhydroxybutyrate depolymerase